MERLRELAEPLVAISLRHLSSATRAQLRANRLSVHVRSLPHGALVFTGSPQYRIPSESDLALVTACAAQAGAQWILFEAEAPIVEGLPTYA